MSDQEFERTQRDCEEVLTRRGLDLFAWFTVGTLNARLEPPHRLPGPEDALGVVIGNSRALWKPFVRLLNESRSTTTVHPLDRYVEGAVREGLERVGSPIWLRFSHQLIPEPIPIQRYAQAAGLAHLSPAHLCVHPLHGPWMALRAVAIFSRTAGARALEGNRAPQGQRAPCEGCAAPCREAFDRALRGDAPLSPVRPPPDLSEKSRRFLAARDACPVGRESRYGDAQILYHYDKKRASESGSA